MCIERRLRKCPICVIQSRESVCVWAVHVYACGVVSTCPSGSDSSLHISFPDRFQAVYHLLAVCLEDFLPLMLHSGFSWRCSTPSLGLWVKEGRVCFLRRCRRDGSCNEGEETRSWGILPSHAQRKDLTGRYLCSACDVHWFCLYWCSSGFFYPHTPLKEIVLVLRMCDCITTIIWSGFILIIDVFLENVMWMQQIQEADK